ncbi:helix-turn-helix domain-containing protein [Actinoplanes sp. NPDC051859]|uniref:helix-turn-helix domain-containing protein n=1 Tax=Actinoplanes sp. NPDC051859 TaxID=3363909 RepID=UPI0037987A3B
MTEGKSPAAGTRDRRPDGPVTYTVEEAAAILGVTPRWLADQCRNEDVDHVHIARKRRFTPEQIEKVLRDHTVTPISAQQYDAERAKVIQRMQRKRSR